MKINVKVTLTIPVEVPDDATFDIEENHCPGTGIVGEALDKHIKEFNEKSFCWACALGGKNEIVD